jgi:xanthine/uracil/vitamin C permease (AzgA family)
VAAVPGYATAPALILVGALMSGSIARVKWDDFTEAFPAFMTVVATPLTFSIATGLSLGLLSFTFLKAGFGRYKEISPLIWILSVLFLAATHSSVANSSLFDAAFAEFGRAMQFENVPPNEVSDEAA